MKIKLPFVDIFDTALEINDDRPTVAREYIYASELGGSFYDRYQNMIGRVPTNPPNKIAVRKFKLGALIEDYFKLILYKAGLLISEEERVINDTYQLHVSGRLDVKFGGGFSFKELDLSEFKFLSFFNLMQNSLVEYAEKFPDLEIENCLLEIKSVADHTFNRIMEGGAMEHNLLQGFHYAHTKQMPLQLVYFDKNNARMASFRVEPNDPYLLRLYKDDIEKMSFYITEGVTPDKERPILFDGKKLSLNWKVLYSKYLSDYGFDTMQEMKDSHDKTIVSFNRVLKRFFDGDKITDDNKKKFHEMIKFGIDLPKEIMDVLRPNKTVVVKEKVVTEYKFDTDSKEVVDVKKKVKVTVPTTKKVSALDKLKGL